MRECVAAFIVKEGKILLGRRSETRSFYPNISDVFGGHIEPGESREDALRRELFEELGIIPTAFEFLLTVAEPFPEKNGAGEYHFYLVRDFAGEAFNKQPSEHRFVGWFSFAEALKLKFAHPFYAVMIRRLTTCTAISALALSLNSKSL